MRIWDKVSKVIRARAVTSAICIIAVILALLSTLLLTRPHGLRKMQENVIEESVVEKSKEGSLRTETQISNFPIEQRETSVKAFHGSETDLRETYLEESKVGTALPSEVTVQEDKAGVSATVASGLREELFLLLEESGIPQSEIDDIMNKAELERSDEDIGYFYELMNRSVDTILENLEGGPKEEEAIPTEPSIQEKIGLLIDEIAAMIEEAGKSPEEIASVEAKIEELTRLFEAHEQENKDSQVHISALSQLNETQAQLSN